MNLTPKSRIQIGNQKNWKRKGEKGIKYEEYIYKCIFKTKNLYWYNRIWEKICRPKFKFKHQSLKLAKSIQIIHNGKWKNSPNINGSWRSISAQYTKPAQLYRACALSSIAPSRFTYRWVAIAAREFSLTKGPIWPVFYSPGDPLVACRTEGSDSSVLGNRNWPERQLRVSWSRRWSIRPQPILTRAPCLAPFTVPIAIHVGTGACVATLVFFLLLFSVSAEKNLGFADVWWLRTLVLRHLWVAKVWWISHWNLVESWSHLSAWTRSPTAPSTVGFRSVKLPSFPHRVEHFIVGESRPSGLAAYRRARRRAVSQSTVVVR
jgi:hypothetical protein